MQRLLPRLLLLGPLLLAGVAAPHAGHAQMVSIVAIVDGDVISETDVENRAKLFALSTGLHMSPEVLNRLRPQVVGQLIDERLRLREVQRRHIVVQDQDIAAALQEIETRNGMPPGALRAKLGSQGVALRTLIDQIRVQLGWTRVLRQELGEKVRISDAEIDAEMTRLKAEAGQPEYHASEIFIAVDNPSHAADARRFADTVIQQLRSGAPFPVVAAQFSQNQEALQGGDLGWVHADQVDPGVAAVLAQMPIGAVSNPIPVPGGISIVTLRARREVGRDIATLMSIRQAFLPFSTPLDPANPNEQQKQQLERAHEIGRTARSCDAIEAANKAAGNVHPSDPGEVRLDQVTSPQFRAVLSGLPVGRASQPLVSNEGIAVIMVCSRDTRNVAELTRDEVRSRMLGERIDLASRQLIRDLQRRASIERRTPQDQKSVGTAQR